MATTIPVRRPPPPPTRPAPKRDFFVYVANILSLSALTTGTTSVQIQSDSDFELQKLSFFADTALAAQTESSRILPLVTLQITDTGTGRQVFSAEVPIPAIMGDGQIPFILPTTKVFTANSSLTIDVTNYAAATDYNLRIALIGSKIFRFG